MEKTEKYSFSKHNARKHFVIDNYLDKRLVFERIFSRAKNIIIVCPYIGGQFFEDLLRTSSSDISIVCHSDLLEPSLHRLIKERCYSYSLTVSYLTSVIHTKYVIVDSRYVFLGSSNYIDQSFGIRKPSSEMNLSDKLMNHISEKFIEIDMFMDCLSLASFLTQYTEERFKVKIQNISHHPNDGMYRFFHKNEFPQVEFHYHTPFKLYLFDPQYHQKNIITERILELMKQSHKATFAIKSFNPIKEIIEQSVEIPLKIYTCLNDRNTLVGRINNSVFSQFVQKATKCQLYNYKDENIMFHHKVFIFRVLKSEQPKRFKTVTLLGSYNLSYRSHAVDSELCCEFKGDFGYKIKKNSFEDHNLEWSDYLPNFFANFLAKHTF